jgi:transcriptional regulator with XRE-family HTH domain
VDIAAEIVAARRRANLTQAELAERSGTSQATISAYESGRKQPAAATFVRLLAAAGTQLAIDPEPRVPVRTASRAERERRGDILAQVIELAEALPFRPSRELHYPRLPGARAPLSVGSA